MFLIKDIPPFNKLPTLRNVVVENSKVKTVGGRINKYMWSNQQGNGRINIHHSLSYIDIPAVVQYVTSHVINALYGSINKDESDSTIYITIPCALASKSKIYQVGGRDRNFFSIHDIL